MIAVRLFFTHYRLQFNLRINAIATALLSLTLCACGGSTVGGDAAIEESTSLVFAAALSAGQSESITIDLSGSQVLPPWDTRETGRASFILDTETRQLYGVLNTSVEDYISVHLHEGGVGEVGATVLELYRQSDGSFVVPSGSFLSPSQTEMFRAGNLYVDVHTDIAEIRGQLSTETIQPEVSATLADIQAQVFTPVCSGCHSGGGNTLPSAMDFTNEQATYNSLIGVNSLSVEGLLRVEPGEPEQSFLIHKLAGTQAVGSRMPLRGTRLNEQTIQSIKQWIALGANR